MMQSSPIKRHNESYGDYHARWRREGYSCKDDRHITNPETGQCVVCDSIKTKIKKGHSGYKTTKEILQSIAEDLRVPGYRSLKKEDLCNEIRKKIGLKPIENIEKILKNVQSEYTKEKTFYEPFVTGIVTNGPDFPQNIRELFTSISAVPFEFSQAKEEVQRRVETIGNIIEGLEKGINLGTYNDDKQIYVPISLKTIAAWINKMDLEHFQREPTLFILQNNLPFAKLTFSVKPFVGKKVVAAEMPVSSQTVEEIQMALLERQFAKQLAVENIAAKRKANVQEPTAYVFKDGTEAVYDENRKTLTLVKNDRTIRVFTGVVRVFDKAFINEQNENIRGLTIQQDSGKWTFIAPNMTYSNLLFAEFNLFPGDKIIAEGSFNGLFPLIGENRVYFLGAHHKSISKNDWQMIASNRANLSNFPGEQILYTWK